MKTVLGFYGKLPNAGDFIQSGETSPTIVGFRKWLDKSSELLASRIGPDRELYNSLPQLGMLIKPPGSKNALVASCISSRDQTGRRAPFAVFAEIPESDYRSYLRLLPVAFNMFLNISTALVKEGGKGFTGPAVNSTLLYLRQGIPVEVTAFQLKLTAYLDRTSLKQFYEALGGANSGAGMFGGILKILGQTRNTIGPGFKGIFRFPIASDSAHRQFEIAFWILSVEKILGLSLSRTTLFWSESYLYMIFDLSSLRTLADVWMPNTDIDTMWQFDKMTPQEDGNNFLSQFIETELKGNEQSLTSFIQGLDRVVAAG